jgi:hypothetical protein
MYFSRLKIDTDAGLDIRLDGFEQPCLPTAADIEQTAIRVFLDRRQDLADAHSAQ